MASFGSGLMASGARLTSMLRDALEIAPLRNVAATESAPYTVVAEEPVYRLRRYGTSGPPLVLVPPLMLTAEVYDIAPDGSAVSLLARSGVDPWVVDFGAPEREEGGLSRTLADHVTAVSDAVDRVRRETGRDVHLGGYSQGGMFCYQAAAYRRSRDLASLITFGSPVDLRRGLPAGVSETMVAGLAGGLEWLASLFAAAGGVPAWISRTGFRMLSPSKELQQQLEFLFRLYDREALQRREGQRRFLAGEGWVAFPGPALQDFIAEFVVHNRLLSGGLVIDGRPVALADISCPVLVFVGEVDEIARPATVRSIADAAPRAPLFEMAMPVGHFGLVVGSKSMSTSWPTVVEWIRWRDRGGPPPEQVRAIDGVTREHPLERDDGMRDGFALVWDAVAAGMRAIGAGVRDRTAAILRVGEQAVPQLSRIARIERVRRDTRISVSLVLAEQARRVPDDTFFLFEGRAYSYAEANRRVDNVARGLISLGVRQGSHVGILMTTRPSALAVAAALSRIGAVAVMLRPEGELEREIDFGGVEHVVADLENAIIAHEAFGKTVWVLGGGGAPRTLETGLVDMEPIDPLRVELPAWYEPDPALAEEVGYILFSGRGARLRANRITHRRWALSAFGAASAAALTSRDTVYCCTPLHHPTGILVCVGGALVGGARLAVALRFDAATFWDEVRRYGASVVFYTGTMCLELLQAAATAAERRHPLRLFAGSGMPRALWTRLRARFAPVGVLEFYATTEGNAILANLTGEKIGSVGRPFAGSADVEIAAYDLEGRDLVREPSGFGRRCADDEVGLLLVRVERERGALTTGRPLRGVFASGDAWIATQDLFRRDDDGDHWLVDHLDDLIRTRNGPLPSIPIEDVIGDLEWVALAIAYGVAISRGRFEIPAIAVIPRRGMEPGLAALYAHVQAELDEASQPVLLRLLEDIPVTAGYRPLKEPLRKQGVDPQAMAGRVFWLDRKARAYRPLDADAATSLGLAGRERRKSRTAAS
jgi:putative long chain acyl-CoA synthase